MITSPFDARSALLVLAAAGAGCVLPGADLVGEGGSDPSTTSSSTTTTTGSGGSGGDGAATTGTASTGGGGDGTGAGGGGAGGSGGDGGAGGAGGLGGAGGSGGAGGQGGTGGQGGSEPLPLPTALDLGLGHACVVLDDGSARCWGRNDRRQVGFDTEELLPAWSASPPTGAGGAIVAMALGDRHTCAIVAIGVDETRVRCWGEDDDGQIGDEGVQPGRIEYADGEDVQGVVEVGAGWRFGCARIAAGDVVCWGDGSQGALGAGAAAPDRPRADRVPLDDDAIDLGTGASASRACAVLAGGVVQCWGDGHPVETVPGTTAATEVAVATVATTPNAGDEIVLVVEDGRVMWTRRDAAGWAPFVELGEFGDLLADARQIEAGQHQVCVVTSDDELHCAGYDAAGLPDESTLALVATAGPVAEVALGSSGLGHTGPEFAVRCVRLVDGTVQCEGSNVEGTIGNGAALVETLPFPVGGVADVRGLAAAATATVAFTGDARVAAGWGTSTVLGTTTAIAPTATILPDGVERLTFGRSIADEAYLWGPSAGFQLRLGPAVETATRLPALPHAFVEGVASTNRDAGRRDDGAVVTLCRASFCNQYGAMGDGTQTTVIGASVVLDLGTFVADAVLGVPASAHHCAVGSDGGARQLWCWGRSQMGQVGTGSTTSVPSPSVILAADVVDACLGATRTCAVVGAPGAREVRCWGGVGAGGPTPASAVPVTIPNSDGATGIACGAEFTCFTREDGGVRCWGENERGQLGDGTLVAHDAPADVPGLDDVTDVVAGSQHACVAHESGAVSCWGRNEAGQLGIGVPVWYPTPVDVDLGGGG